MPYTDYEALLPPHYNVPDVGEAKELYHFQTRLLASCLELQPWSLTCGTSLVDLHPSS